MAGDPFQQVASGQPVRNSARLHNVVVRMAREWEGKNNGAGGGDPHAAYHWETVLVLNNSGSDVDRYGVLGISGVAISPADNAIEWDMRPVFTGVTPVVGHFGKTVILLEPITNGDIGRAFVEGVFPALINVRDTHDGYADLLHSDSTKLQSYPGGHYQILWAESGTGTKKAWVRFNPLLHLSGRVTTATATNSLYNGKSWFFGQPVTVSSAGSFSSTENVKIWNTAELGNTTDGHMVTDSANIAKFALGFDGPVMGIDQVSELLIVHSDIKYAGC